MKKKKIKDNGLELVDQNSDNNFDLDLTKSLELQQ